MKLEKYLTNNSYLIIPNNLKTKVVKYLNSLDKIYNTKIITISELKTKLLFGYSVETIHYIMNRNNIDFNNANELIKNMYYLFEDSYNNKKIDNLNKLKKELLDKNLLIIDPYFKESIKNKKVFVYGFDYINKYNQKLINSLKKITTIQNISKNNNNNNYSHPIYNFDHINYEIEYVANDIINKKLDLNHTYIYGINKDNESTIKRIFNNYNLKINLPSNTSLFETKIGSDFLLYLNDPNKYLENIKNNDIKDLIIDILNKYYWVQNKNDVKDMLEYEFKLTHIPKEKYKNAINTTSLFNDYFDDNDYVYVINFNAEYIPKIYKDIDFISDNEKFCFLETTSEKNYLEKEKWKMIIKNIKNLTITSSNQNLNGILNVSPLVNDFKYEVVNKEYISSNYSNKSNLFNLGIILDNYQKYNIVHKELSTLLTTYPNHNFLSYDNKYLKIKLRDDLKFNLSYSKMNTYYECPFKYYCDNILKLNKQKETFDTWTGSLCHFILSKIYDDNFDYESAKKEFTINHPFELTNENVVFLNKILSELLIAIKYIKSLQNITKYQIIETEKNINVEINNTNFVGIIDKIMHYNNNIVLIDYKTGTPDIDLRLANFGLNMQLPTYVYLIKKVYPNSNIVGIYLQHILKPNFNKEISINSNEQYEKSLKLTGYSLGNEAFLQDFDPTYENSNYINSMKLSTNGFSSYSKVLTADNFKRIEELAENKINECIDNIKNATFDIEPKMVGIENITCDFCTYKSVCFKTEKDLKYLKLDNNLSFLKGDKNELD